MPPIAVALVAFACIFGGVLLAMALRSHLPAHHTSKETQDAVKLGMGIVATLTAMVLGLLVASAKGSLSTKDTEIRQFCAKSVQLDHTLAQFGTEAAAPRQQLRRFLQAKIDQIWPQPGRPPAADVDLDTVERQVRMLEPHDALQRQVQLDALRIMAELQAGRWQLIEQLPGGLPMAAVIILTLWVTALFASFGLFVPRNALVFAALLVATLSIAMALFLILEMELPFRGLIQVSSAPARTALERMGPL